MDKYEITKTIRFKLHPQGDISPLTEKLRNNTHTDLSEFIDDLEHIKNVMKGILHKKGDSSGDLNPLIKIKHRWLRSYTNYDFFPLQAKERGGNRLNPYSLTALPYLKKEIHRWLCEWESIISSLDEYRSRGEHEQQRRMAIARLLSSLRGRQNFPFIKDLANALCNTNKPDLDERIDKAIKNLRDTEQSLLHLVEEYLPSQSAGVTIAKGTFNYYTLNKTSKFYGDEKKYQETLLSNTGIYKKLESRWRKTWQQEARVSQQNSSLEIWFKDIGIKEDLKEFSLEDLYSYLKKWKSEKKSFFMEKIQKDKTASMDLFDPQTEFFLFSSCEENIDEFINKTKQILAWGNLPEKKEEIKKLKKKRGEFFDIKKRKTENYRIYCEIYKLVAREYGNIKAKIKGLEQESLQARLLEYWCFILEEDGQHILFMIPEAKRREAKRYLYSLQEKGTQDSSGTAYLFKSFTLRALRKLCFGVETKNEDFASSIKREWEGSGKEYISLYGERSDDKEKAEIKFFQNVLETDHARNVLDLSDFENLNTISKKSYGTRASFESDLNKCCYIKKAYKFTKEDKKKIKRDFKALEFQITSLDLRRKKQVPDVLLKEHTKIWKNFWKNSNEKENYSIRLNPEIAINWREAKKSRVKKYGKGTPLYNPDLSNRYLTPQYNLLMTITSSAGENKQDLSFTSSETIFSAISKFNDKFNLQNKGSYCYGIDRGRNELATLCITKFKNSEKGKYGIKPNFPEIEAYELEKQKFYYKNKEKKGYDKSENFYENENGCTTSCGGPIKNISYYIEKVEDPKWFKKVQGSVLDLTAAKLIKGKIILNGDLLTLLALKERAARRKLFELFHGKKINKESKMDSEKSRIYIEIKEDGGTTVKNHPIYYFIDKESDSNKKKIEKKLKDYLNQSCDREDTIEKINNFRDAITANMVGIIVFLHKRHPAQLIALENMQKEEHIEKHFHQSNEDISRRLEWALYRKFQNESLVPPQVKQSVILREKPLSNKCENYFFQLGIVIFVKIENTSKECPRCGFVNKRRFSQCQECSFNLKNPEEPLKMLKTNDGAAAYNVAKRGYRILALDKT